MVKILGSVSLETLQYPWIPSRQEARCLISVATPMGTHSCSALKSRKSSLWSALETRLVGKQLHQYCWGSLLVWKHAPQIIPDKGQLFINKFLWSKSYILNVLPAIICISNQHISHRLYRNLCWTRVHLATSSLPQPLSYLPSVGSQSRTFSPE